MKEIIIRAIAFLGAFLPLAANAQSSVPLGPSGAVVGNLSYTPLAPANNLSDVANATTSRGNLSAAKSGANSDITSITGLTTALSIAQGGTGSTTAGAALTALGAAALAGGNAFTGVQQIEATGAAASDVLRRLDVVTSGTIASLLFQGYDANPTNRNYVAVNGLMLSNTAGAYSGELQLQVAYNGALVTVENMRGNQDVLYVPLSLVNYAVPSTTTGYFSLGQFQVTSENAALTNGAAFTAQYTFGGSSVTGSRNALVGQLAQNAANTNNPNRNYVGVLGQVSTSSGDGGTDLLNTGNTLGGYFSSNFHFIAYSGAVNTLEFTDQENDVDARTGSSTWWKNGVSVASIAGDAIHGARFDNAYSASGSGGVGFTVGLEFCTCNGGSPFADYASVATTAILVDSNITLGIGFDVEGTIQTDFLKYKTLYSVDASGNETAASVTSGGAISGLTLAASSTASISGVTTTKGLVSQSGTYGAQNIGGTAPVSEFLGSGSTAGISVGYGGWASSGGTTYQALYYISRGAAPGSFGASVSTDNVRFKFFGDDGSTTGGVAFAQISASVTGTVSTGVVPGQLIFSTWNLSGTIVTDLTLSGASATFGVTLGIPQATWADNQTCTAGQISVDASYVYACTASNTVKRAALSTF